MRRHGGPGDKLIHSGNDEPPELATAWRLQRAGNFVAAYDLAQATLVRFPDSQPLAYLSVLALASCGATEAALEALRAGSLDADSLSANDTEDVLALEARLLKDLAFTRGGDVAMLRRAAQTYEEVAQRTDGTYSRLNAALLSALAGEFPRAQRLAASVVERIAAANVPEEEEAAYFHWATLAEAALVLGDRDLLEHAVSVASPLCRSNSWARSRTLSQMQRLGSLRPELSDLVERWYRPAIGLFLPADALPPEDMPAQPLDAADRPALIYCVAVHAQREWQALSATGIPLHLIHAGPPDGVPGSSASRYRGDASGHEGAHTWSSLLLDEDDPQERICAEVALGLSLSQAGAQSAPYRVLSQAGGHWYSYRDVDEDRLRSAIASPVLGAERSRYSFLFADAVSYSTLNAADTRRYWTQYLPETAAAVLRRHASSLVLRKTWGDAVHAVFDSAHAAARAALDMQEAAARVADGLGQGRRLSFRVALHHGSADRGFDPVEETPSVFGPQLSFAARIVPVAPPGGVFVTEPFAAQLELEGARDVHCHYVGTTSLAKSYGRVRLLRLAGSSL
jgi:class 3 adenylate cyclase